MDKVISLLNHALRIARESDDDVMITSLIEQIESLTET